MTSQAHDIAELPGYTAGKVPRVWLVDVPARIVTEHTEPSGRSYACSRVVRGADLLDVQVDGIPAISAEDLLSVLAD